MNKKPNEIDSSKADQTVPHCISSMSGVIRKAFWPTAEFSDICNFSYTEDPDVVIINGPGTPQVGKLNCNTQKFAWKAPFKFWTTSYNPRTRRVLGYDIRQGILVELDADNGRVVRSVSSTNLGKLGTCASVRYLSPYSIAKSFKVYDASLSDDPDLVVVADTENHVAGIISLKASEFVWSFGEYGVAGSDNKHLNCPRDICTTIGNDFWIADSRNHRLLDVTRTTSNVANHWIFPRPMSVGFSFNTANSHFFSANGAVSTESFYQPLTLVLSDFDKIGLDRYTSIIGWVPIATNRVEFNPLDPSLLQVNQWNSAFEVDYMKAPTDLKFMTRFSKPYATNQKVAQGQSIVSEPVVGLVNDKMLAKIFVSHNATAIIEVPEPALRLLAVPADYSWVPMMESSLKAKMMNQIPFTHVPSVFRIKVLASGGDLQASIYVEGL